MVGGRRAALRRGEDIPGLPEGPQKGILISVPLFHVTGLTSLAVCPIFKIWERYHPNTVPKMLATMAGLKIVMMRKWNPNEGNDPFV